MVSMDEFLDEILYNSSMHTTFNQIDCTICMEDFENNNILYSLLCGHVFHKDCVSTYLIGARHKVCPICRQIIIA